MKIGFFAVISRRSEREIIGNIQALREHGFSLYHSHSVVVQPSSDDTTLGFKKGDILPCPEPFSQPILGISSQRRLWGKPVEGDNVIYAVQLAQSSKHHFRDRFRDGKHIKICAQKASAVLCPSGRQQRPTLWHVSVTSAISSH